MKKLDTRLIGLARSGEAVGEDSWVALTPIDIKMPRHQMPMVFAFLSPAPSDFLSRLENGLKKVLLHYSVLAGRVKNYKIHLNNEGVPVTRASTDTSLKEHLTLGFEFLHQLTPSSSDISIPFMIQVTEFRCGCVALGFARLHNVVDSNAFPIFLSDLAAAVRTDDPTLNLASHDRTVMMPRDPPSPIYDHNEYKVSIFKVAPFKVVATAVHMSADKLTKLQAECNTGNLAAPYSTYVSLAAYLWKLMALIRGLEGNAKTICMCPIDGRRFLGIPLQYFGNVVFRATPETTVEEILEKPLSFTAGLISSKIKKASNPEYMRSVLDFLALSEKDASNSSTFSTTQQTSIGLSPNILITSWSRLPIYDIDFGFGTPVKVSPTNLPWEGYITVAPSGKKDGSLDVVVNLFEQHLRTFVSLVEKATI